ncbi:MAG: O-antigen ligase family protein [Anaerolineales bacterium]|nr:O-antigen ligase family protein [Anaerolineales bacterium]
MFSLRYRFLQSPLVYFADQILALELLWPFPLIAVGVLQILEPLVVEAAIVLAVLPWAVRWLVLGRPTRQTFMGGALALLGASGLVGVWASYDPNLSWPLFLTLLGSMSLFFALINTYISPERLSSGLVMAAALVACYFVGQYNHFNYPLEVGQLADLGRVTGSLLPTLVFFTPHPNAVASFLEGTVFLGLVTAWGASGGKRVAWGIVVALIVYAVLISGSRGAWVGLTVAGAIWGLLLIPNRGLRLAVAGAGLAAVTSMVLAAVWLTRSGWTIPVVTSAMDTAASRLTLYRNSLYLWSDYPFTGIGLGDAFALVYSRYQLLLHVPFLTYSHNLFLSAALGLGILGLVAVIWLLIDFYAFVVRVGRVGLSQPSRALFRAAWLGTTVIVVHGLIDSPQFSSSGWTMPMLFAVFGLTVAIGCRAFTELEVKLDREHHPVNYRVWWVIGSLIVVLGVTATFFWRPLLSAWYVNMGSIYQTEADLSPGLDDTARKVATTKAIIYFERALNLNPASPVSNRRLGMMALSWNQFNPAAEYLEKAHRQESGNQATLKALGLAYLWLDRLDEAEPLLRQLDNQGELIKELGTWSNWQESQGQIKLSQCAKEMAHRLSVEP